MTYNRFMLRLRKTFPLFFFNWLKQASTEMIILRVTTRQDGADVSGLKNNFMFSEPHNQEVNPEDREAFSVESYSDWTGQAPSLIQDGVLI